jgi:hypothetical protein
VNRRKSRGAGNRTTQADEGKVVTTKVDRPPKSTTSTANVESLCQRRRVASLPKETAEFNIEHTVVGAIFMADIAYDATGPEFADQRTKFRPALAVAAAESAILVRGTYSISSTTRTIF